MKRVLGLDLGTDSIGWALLDVPENGDEGGRIVALGTRVFSAGAEVRGVTATTKAAERRLKRSMRRQTERRRRRKALLRAEFASVDLLPEDERSLEALFALDPALLADRAMMEKITLHEFGRILYNMTTRRGFLSLRSGGAAVGGDDGEKGADAEGFRHWRQRLDIELRFDELWGAQAPHHPGTLTNTLRDGARGRQTYPVAPVGRDDYRPPGSWPIAEFGVHGLVFFQRAVYWHKGTVGTCLLTGEPRIERADRLAQRFKILQTLANIRVYDCPGGRFLDDDERSRLFDVLWAQKTVGFGKVRKTLRITGDIRISHEQADGDTLEGNETDAALKKSGAKGSIGPRYAELSEEIRDRIVSVLLDTGRPEDLHSRLVALGLTSDEADRALKTGLPRGRDRFSRTALEKLIPEVEQGYKLNARAGEESAIARTGFIQTHERNARDGRKSVYLERVPDVTNPIVRATLNLTLTGFTPAVG
ncbi:MAG: type II CRISPR RNA-guided endonuclease Cas9, partial [Actinomycetota bacterium]